MKVGLTMVLAAAKTVTMRKVGQLFLTCLIVLTWYTTSTLPHQLLCSIQNSLYVERLLMMGDLPKRRKQFDSI